ncbi:MAG: hypothetical protein UR29_C0009G0041 [Candidatus Woesebacteria bacterium GW2011_GWC2_33_12]|uniref:Uncharacterized protein n=1 Tax=Candidatus Woesebacteria bacterium GW2011_GWB1_33_22 TaxID=1618566 RepID=A0A0F9ZLW4_9BACT|nr:MAG: hypothetical protein UR29_C0009G0041 [Candidatus Woesebacteria bacterium GW2011_GWC2_33_12]KKP42465.1 MAG: hypothetical protein UR33_C0002G0041 [Candidatus Woesebacteria bacterium GW2011_GWA2_33_20]KKP45208.1 MAG: hypothetical protein UR35_C0002G0041 [Candidatus Woesebacteria bacterium GW2011_GWB1_33_22]KKP46207.1 MAG: hypothetical protein UR37_C0011G0041 [Microgenomates group bacterium GW2011_GWC1_33_28]KKP50877.1 MAG: hypothetical protein UR41_C0002G0041 [Candidatus Woesebacteria bact
MITRKQRKIFTVLAILAGIALLAGSILPFIAYL